jgi:hypothetical protein
VDQGLLQQDRLFKVHPEDFLESSDIRHKAKSFLPYNNALGERVSNYG